MLFSIVAVKTKQWMQPRNAICWFQEPLCFCICPFCATRVCVASKQVQIQPQMGTGSSTRNTTLCFVFLIWDCLVYWITQNECLTTLLLKPVLATAAQLGLICCRRKGEESLLLQDKHNPGMWLQIRNSSLPSAGWCVENKTQHDGGFWSWKSQHT